MPSGTMCNVAATLVHCRPGDEILAHETAHIIAREGGAHAALGGFQITPLHGADGQFSPETFRKALHPRTPLPAAADRGQRRTDRQYRRRHHLEKGRARRDREDRERHGLATHMDGARLLNACVATGIAAHDMAAGWDSAWIDFSKGLGAPIGGVIAGSRDFIDEVWRWKQRLGGSMRQAGICAAACTYALDHHVDRLAEDHANARALARGLSQINGIEVQEPETNLVFFKPDGAGVSGEKMVERLAQARRAAGHDGRPHPRLHPSRCHRRHDRGDGRPGARDRAGGLRFSTQAPHRSASSASLNPPALRGRLHHEDHEHIVHRDR